MTTKTREYIWNINLFIWWIIQMKSVYWSVHGARLLLEWLGYITKVTRYVCYASRVNIADFLEKLMGWGAGIGAYLEMSACWDAGIGVTACQDTLACWDAGISTAACLKTLTCWGVRICAAALSCPMVLVTLTTLKRAVSERNRGSH